MSGEKVYIKIEQNTVVKNKMIYLEEVAKIYCANQEIEKKLGKEVLMVIHADKKRKYCFSIMRVVEIIMRQYPDITVVNLGEKEFILSFEPKTKENKLWEYSKTVFVALIIFFGGAFTIMTFNTDVGVGEVFQKSYDLLGSSNKSSTFIVEIAYSIGLPVGIILFFNHFMKKKLDSDPTPIQVEMRKYETDVNAALIENSSREGKIIDSN